MLVELTDGGEYRSTKFVHHLRVKVVEIGSNFPVEISEDARDVNN